jgi:hypothetical protein
MLRNIQQYRDKKTGRSQQWTISDALTFCSPYQVQNLKLKPLIIVLGITQPLWMAQIHPVKN